MTEFDSTLIIETEAKKDFKLPHTLQIILSGSRSAVQSSPFSKYLYMYNGDIVVYQLNPFRQIQKFEYNGDAEDIAVVGNKMAMLSKDSIVVFDRDTSRLIAGFFGGSQLSNIEGDLGVQGRSKLCVYSMGTLELLREYKCNSHYSIRDVLLTSYDHEVLLYHKGKKILEIFMPDRISRICTDPLLTNIYCGGIDGRIFCSSMNYREPTTMSHHKSEIVGLDMSFCGKYLYSADTEGTVCIWDTKFNVVVGKISLGSPARRMRVAYVSEWSQGEAEKMEKEVVGPRRS